MTISDQDRNFHYNIITIPSRQVIKIEKHINLGIVSWSNIKFFKPTSRIIWQTVSRVINEVLGVKGLINFELHFQNTFNIGVEGSRLNFSKSPFWPRQLWNSHHKKNSGWHSKFISIKQFNLMAAHFRFMHSWELWSNEREKRKTSYLC